jgi:hypothetical protein
MKNLSKAIFSTFFPELIMPDDSQGEEVLQCVEKVSQRSRHDPHQRKGQMHAPHNQNHCEACQHGWCFA